MHSTHILSLLTALITIAIQMNPVTADCCPCPIAFKCNDGTKCTPYCGYGQCNIFGCNCDGGCRSSYKSMSPQKLHGVEDASEDYFKDADANHDGTLTFDEWAASAQNKGVDHKVLQERWAKYDLTKVGGLSKMQAIMRTA